jgi:hypothetical protein
MVENSSEQKAVTGLFVDRKYLLCGVAPFGLTSEAQAGQFLLNFIKF